YVRSILSFNTYCSPYILPHDSRTLLYFFFNATATTAIYTLSLHDALPISRRRGGQEILRLAPDGVDLVVEVAPAANAALDAAVLDLKSTRLNSSHDQISYAVFCLKKKKKKKTVL